MVPRCGQVHLKPRARALPVWTLFVASLCAALAGVFVLPFFFPPSHALPSQAYVVGYNNRVAWASLALVSGLVFLLSVRGGAPAPRDRTREPALSWRWLAGVLLLVVVWNGALSWLVFAAHGYAVEDFYFLPQLEKFYFLHRPLYSEIEFTYGPLLFYPPIWLHWLLTPFHVSLRASYYVSTLFEHLAGAALLYFVVHCLPMPRVNRLAAFASVALFSFTPLLGPNYTLLRYMLPIALFVLLARIARPLRAAGATFFAQMLVWLDSTEMAVAFGFAVTVYCCYRAWRHRSVRWLLPIAAVAGADALYLAILSHEELSSLVSIAHGWANRVPLPSLEVVTLLIAAVWLVPRLVAGHVSRDSPQSGLLLGLYAMGLALLPASLGLSDIVHIGGNSLVLFLLSLVAIAEWKPRARSLWIATVAATYLLLVIRTGLETHFLFYPDVACIEGRSMPLVARLPPRLASRLRGFEQRWPCNSEPLDAGALHAAIGETPFAAPYAMPEIVEEALPGVSNFVPSYWSGTINLWDRATEQRKVDELRQTRWALLPGHPEPTPVAPNVNARFSIPTHYRVVHPMTWDGVLADEIDRNWAPAGNIGPYLLYRRIR
jgi:hypothetical protein